MSNSKDTFTDAQNMMMPMNSSMETNTVGGGSNLFQNPNQHRNANSSVIGSDGMLPQNVSTHEGIGPFLPNSKSFVVAHNSNTADDLMKKSPYNKRRTFANKAQDTSRSNKAASFLAKAGLSSLLLKDNTNSQQ